MSWNKAVLWIPCGVLVLGLTAASVISAREGENPGKGSPKAKKSDASQAEVTVKILNWEESQAIVKQHKGKIVVLDLWSTSCEPCMKEFPNLVKLHKQQSKDVACVSVSADYAGSKKKPPEYYQERVLTFLTQQGATFDNVLLNVPSDELFEKLELASIPAVYVYGRDGKLVKRFDGDSSANVGTDDEAFTYADVNKLVDSLLKKK